jgi:spermidine/putrescine transport system substrate-binding protein
MKKIVIRSCIILGWTGILFIALYFPKFGIFSFDKNTINIFTWGDILEPSVVADFEEETGIKVNFNYYSSNEELLVKMKATKGEGYDLIIPSDYATDTLIKEHLLKKIDKSKLNFWNKLYPRLLGHSFDPYNHYSIPFAWEIFLFGINKEYFKDHKAPKSWGMIFNESTIDYKISMTNDPIEATLFASFYLFGPKFFLNKTETELVKNLLITQKRWVEAYASFRGDYFLATENCQVAVASSSYLWRTQKIFPSVGFVIPEEGTFITIESLSIPKASKKEHLTYQFINYLFKESSTRTHFDTFGFFPSTLQSLDNLELNPEAKELLFSSEERFRSFYFLHEVMPQQQMTDIWVEVKSGKY